jgi:hypothetical protein
MKSKDLIYILPLSLALGAWFALAQKGDWTVVLASIPYSFLFLLSFVLLKISVNWANGGKTLAWIVALTFGLRLLFGLVVYLGLPVYGHADSEDDKAGYIFTDAHLRDDQAWNLAASERPILSTFTDKFRYDQYGGLLALSAFMYRYLSPDVHRPLLLILLSAFVAAVGIPFLWRAASQVFGERVAYASAWIVALYPEGVLLGSSAMREPYLVTFSAMAFWGFVAWRGAGLDTRLQDAATRPALQAGWIWFGVGLLGMLLVSPAVALATLIIFAGWLFFTNERRSLSWKPIVIFLVIFAAGVLFLSASLNRSGQFDASSPFSVINDWLKLSVKWDVYQLERGSGWVQKLFDEMSEWMRLPFVATYGILQPVLPATFFEPDNSYWQVIYIVRAAGWYVLLPMLILSYVAGAGELSEKKRNLILWLALLVWTWILLAALRGGGDSWDNPRYRTILFIWEAILAGYVWVWWRETHNPWFARVVICEVVFLLVFMQWYASRYFHWGGQLPFAAMVGLIVVVWCLILGAGWWSDRKRA